MMDKEPIPVQGMLIKLICHESSGAFCEDDLRDLTVVQLLELRKALLELRKENL